MANQDRKAKFSVGKLESLSLPVPACVMNLIVIFEVKLGKDWV